MHSGHFVCGTWGFIPMIFFGIMMLGCLFFFLRGGVRRWRGWETGRTSCGGARVLGERPLELLAARYARGEISKQEFAEMCETLRDDGGR